MFLTLSSKMAGVWPCGETTGGTLESSRVSSPTPQILFASMIVDGTATTDALSGGPAVEQHVQSGGSSSVNAAWTDGETKLLLDYYAKYAPYVGPMKKFKCKRAMFEQIARDMFALLNVVRTGVQCESRFKTIAKSKRNEDRNNRTCGHSRCNVVFEEEFASIRAIDDSLEPEVLRGVKKVMYKRLPSAAHATAKDPNLESSIPSNSGEHRHGSVNTAPPEQVGNGRLDCDGTTPKGRPERPRNQRPSTDRMKHMKMFFDEMYKVNEQREARKEERERKREEARSRRHQEILQAHADYVEALREIAKEGRVSATQ
ncbi:uncharacterized protein [Dermacentor albipictus]|uniref:uncharacterized protein n=1 Tax=Dermacentor albipictus TaxID=60249 RepID=UPI0031FE2558